MRPWGTRTMFILAATAGVLLLAPASSAAAEGRCHVPPFLAEPDAPLARAARTARDSRRLSILLLSGSPSQTGGLKGQRSYPAYLEGALRRSLPGIQVSVEVQAKARQSAAELLPDLPAALDRTRPALVIWQIGTVDALRGSAPSAFGRSLRRGIAEIRERGADALLVDMQFGPWTDRLADYASYLWAIRDVADMTRTPLFDRYEIMRYWSATGAFDLASLKDDGLYEKIHECIGGLLADFILHGTGLREGKGIGG